MDIYAIKAMLQTHMHCEKKKLASHWYVPDVGIQLLPLVGFNQRGKIENVFPDGSMY